MNFSRIIVSRGYAAFTLGRISLSHKAQAATTTIFKFPAAAQTKFALPHRSYATQNITKETTPPITTRLEEKIKNLEKGVLTTPGQTKQQNTGLKKRTARKKRLMDEIAAHGYFNINAFATAEEYDLEALLQGLNEQSLYEAKKFFSTDNLGVEQDVLYVTAKYKVGKEERDIFFFREGSVVLWNCNEIETNNVLTFLKPYEREPYLRPLVRGESEVMPYTYVSRTAIDVEGDPVSFDPEMNAPRAFFQNGKFFLISDQDNFLQKYTFSNAIATSIKLGIWEATLDRFIDSIEYLTQDLKKGRRLRISRADVLRKMGELFALRHAMNLSSDLLDTPDFYWDREELEDLYLQVCSYFSISRRTKVANEKINHCIELAELVSSNLNDAHHVRLEWMIIILIMVEVGFEIVHYMER